MIRNVLAGEPHAAGPSWPVSLAGALVLASALTAGPLSAAPLRFNDTGQYQCFDPVTALQIDCAGSGQDGATGRDPAQPSDRDGPAGFKFTKVGADGSLLAPKAKRWACVQDEITGLMWEVKTADAGPRDGSRVYTRGGNDDQAAAFVEQVNSAGLCGHTDWRLPSFLEMATLVDFSPLGRDAKWFPNTAGSTGHWASDPSELYGSAVEAYYSVTFEPAEWGVATASNAFAVRVVRGVALPVAGRFKARTNEVRDSLTGLSWRRCSEGQTWVETAGTCEGSPTLFTWAEALAHAQAVAADGKGWRLPNAKELASLIDTTRPGTQPAAIDTVLFPGTVYTVPYWSGSPASNTAPVSRAAWRVDFGNGGQVGANDNTARHPVRLVRPAP